MILLLWSMYYIFSGLDLVVEASDPMEDCKYPVGYQFLRRNISLSYGEFEAIEMECADAEPALRTCANQGGRLPRFNTPEDLDIIGEMHSLAE